MQLSTPVTSLSMSVKAPPVFSNSFEDVRSITTPRVASSRSLIGIADKVNLDYEPAGIMSADAQVAGDCF